jgi:type I restriction enzyme S subunit
MGIAIDKFKIEKYSSYKNSGAEWMGDIPDNWDSIKMKHLYQDVSIKKKADAELLSVTQDQGVVPRTWVENRMVMPSGALESFKFINKGDFAISLRSFEGGLEYCHHDGIISPAYTVLKAKRNFESKFYKYLFKSFSFISELQTSVVGIRQGKNISFEELSYSFLPIPPLPEQTAIADFLDRKTSLIDQAIYIKQKQIELLKERRQILIHKAVTRGLNPDAKMKDSGVEWIGEIPEGWEILPGFKVYKENKSNNIGMKQKVVLSLSYGNIVIKPEEKLVGLVPESFETYQIVKPGDIIIRCMDLQNDKTSLRTGIAMNDGIITSAYLNLNIINGNNSDYMYNFLHSLDTTKVLYKFGTGLRQNLNYSDFKRMPILVPPKVEQNQIIEFIEKLKNKIAIAISLKEQEIEKLKEYKATLINSAVTGKIKVYNDAK